MARSLNSRCDFKQGFFTCDLPVDTVELILQAKTKCRKHTLREDQEKRTEKYRPWERCTDNDSPRCILDSLSPSVTSDSGPWLPTPKFDYKSKLFDDPRANHSNKENMPILEPAPIPVLNIEESNFFDRTKKLVGKDNKWEAHVAQQVPLPRSSFPYPNNDQSSSLEQLKPETEDDMDIRDFLEGPINDQRPPKPPRKPKVMLQNLIPPPGFPDYMTMDPTMMGIPKPQHTQVRGIIPEKKKVPRGWSTCLKRSHSKVTFHNKDIYSKNTDSSENHYDKPKEKETQEENSPQEKNMRIFYKLNVKENVNITSTPCKEEYGEKNYESI